MGKTDTLHGSCDVVSVEPDPSVNYSEWDGEVEEEDVSFAQEARSSFASLLGPAAVIVAVFAACLLFGGRMPLQEQPGESPSRSASPISFSIPEVGAQGTLVQPSRESGDVPVARSAAACQAMEHPEDTSRTPQTSGQTDRVVSGTPVTFVKYDWGSYEVRLGGSGSHAGERVWVAERFWVGK
jgi:hypothetical protein